MFPSFPSPCQEGGGGKQVQRGNTLLMQGLLIWQTYSCLHPTDLWAFGLERSYPFLGYLVPSPEWLLGSGVFGDSHFMPLLSLTGCRPYSIPPCEHHVNGSRPPCTGEGGETPRCSRHCEPGYSPSYKEDKHYGKGGGLQHCSVLQSCSWWQLGGVGRVRPLPKLFYGDYGPFSLGGWSWSKHKPGRCSVFADTRLKWEN